MKIFGKNIWLLLLALIIVPSFTLPANAATKSKNKKYTVMIDPGHGGTDIGAYEHGVREKDVNLAVALKLGNLIKKKYNDIEVIYTRDKDTFVKVRDRSELANKAHADLFISIHTNSAAKENPDREKCSGASVYTLGPNSKGNDKDQDNLDVAHRENSVILLEGDKESYEGFDPNKDESYIIFEMMQKANRNSSIKLATDIQKHLVKEAGRYNRGVKQDTFWLLWATSMPSVLIELDFVCNPEIAKFLGSNEGQDKLAQAIFLGFKDFYTDYKKQVAQKPDKQAQEEDTTPNDFKSDVVVTSTNTERQVSQAPEMKSAKSNASTARKRRNDAARQASAEREIEVAVIDQSLVSNDAVVVVDNNAAAEKPQPEKATKTDNKADSKKKEVKKADNKKKEPVQEMANVTNPDKKATARTRTKTETAPKPVKIEEPKKETKQPKTRDNGNDSVKPRLNSYYCVKLFESAEKIKENDEMLQGISGKINVHQQDGKYIYTVGHYAERNDTLPVIDTVKDRFPQAKAVRVNAGNNRIVQ